jgi:isopentenyldiphosphate isomerase
MAELQEVLTEQGEPTGEFLTKQEIFARGLWRLVTHVWLVDGNGELLVQRRAVGKGIFDGLWDVTIGGGVAAREKSADAAVRELKEELGITAHATELIFIKRFKLPKIIPETGQQMNDFSDTYALFQDVDLVEINQNLKHDEVSQVKKIRLHEIVDEMAQPERSKLWVPHGGAYYRDVVHAITGLAA